MKAILLFFDSQDLLSRTVTDSQVVEFIRLQTGRGHRFRYVNSTGVRDWWRKRKAFSMRKHELEKDLGSKPFLIRTFKPGTALGRFILRLSLTMFVVSKGAPIRQVFIHARGHEAARIVLPLKRIFGKVRVLFDVRGDLSSEIAFRSKSQENETANGSLQVALREQDLMEKDALDRSDHISCVSSKLRDHLLAKHALTKSDRFHVFPSAGDADRFKPDRCARDRTRERLGLVERLVLLYSGGVGAWHETDRLLDAFEMMRVVDPSAFFLFLTPFGAEIEPKFLSRGVPRTDYSVLAVPHAQIHDYVNAADFGILLRRRHALNAAASPTKFSEYVLTGLPVLISDGIGDASEFVAVHNAGILVKDFTSDADLCARIGELMSRSYDREAIQKHAVLQFSKQSYLDEYDSILAL